MSGSVWIHRFVHPEWAVPLGVALLLLGAAFAAASAWAHRRRRVLLGEDGRVTPGPLRSDLALWLAALAIGVAITGPRIGERVERAPANGVDVVFGLDVSRSMDARDVPPSRLDRARRAMEELLDRLAPQDRAGLVAFAGGAVLLAPLTPDRELLMELASVVDTDLILPRSSDLGAGVRTALSAFERGSERPRVLVLLADGEDPERRRDLAAAEAARAGVRVVSLAFGTEAGATLPDHGVPLVDAGGRTVVSRRDTARLETLAEATDGASFAADAWGVVDFGTVADTIRRDAGTAPGGTVLRRVPAVQVWPFAALAFVLLCIEGQARPRRIRPSWRSARSWAPTAAVLLLAAPSPAGDAALAPLGELEARVREHPRDPAALVALGAARMERGRRDAAARAFLAAAVHARDPEAAARAYFDLGVVELERQDLPAARRAFLDALALDPDDEKARFNLEWTLLALEQQAPREPELPEPPRPAPPPSREDEEEPPPDAGSDESEDGPPAADAEEPPALSEAEQQRLLERIEDDPGRALRSAAGSARRASPRGAVVW